VPPGGGLSTGAERGLDPVAGVAVAGQLEQHLADLDPPLADRGERQPRDDEVAPQQRGVHALSAHQRGDHGEVLALDQGDLALAARAPGRAVVAAQPVGLDRLGRGGPQQGRLARGREEDGVKHANLGDMLRRGHRRSGGGEAPAYPRGGGAEKA
jgi:hypothetical protein